MVTGEGRGVNLVTKEEANNSEKGEKEKQRQTRQVKLLGGSRGY